MTHPTLSEPFTDDLFATAHPAVRATAPPRRSAQAASPEALLHVLRTRHSERIAGQLITPARSGEWASLPPDCNPRLREALRQRGIDRLYSHQREAWDHVQRGEDIVLATPTASGKSLCYNLPVIDAVLTRGAKALYLFPTKALAQDQVAELLAINDSGRLGLRASTFDGDTPADARRAVRVHGDIVVTNPDMLHQSILPHHTKWAQLFENLAFVVIDELHTYRGVFGAHVANLIARLHRILAFYRSTPRFITCSATIGNPDELASRLIGRRIHPITQSGAPSGERHLLIWNPPIVNADLGLRASARSQSTLLARQAIDLGLKTIVFTNSRLEVEVITKYLKDIYDADPRHAARILAYRGGYLPTERHSLEASLRSGTPDAVVSTSALELGIDIGALDVCILNGYPGSVASALQRFGRAGRRNRTAVGILVASSEMLDQYLARHPDFFLGASAEEAVVDPEQLLIQMEHLRCAAFELPFRTHEQFGAETVESRLAYLEGESVLHEAGGEWHWIADSYPANAISLRAVADGNFTVIDVTGGGKTVIAEVDYSAAAMTLYEGAIYMVQSAPWQVERLDWTGRKAFVRRTRVDYYTDAIDYTRLKVLDCFNQAPSGRGQSQHGEVHVVRHVSGYKKIRYYTHENVGYGPVNLPDQEMHTFSLWWDIPAAVLDEAFADRQAAIDGFIGAAYTLQHMAALVSLCSVRDIGRAVGDGNGTWSAVIESHRQAALPDSGAGAEGAEATPGRPFRPTLFLYDNTAGGSGLAPALFERRSEIVDRALSLIVRCECSDGCPACVGPILRSDPDGKSGTGGSDVTDRSSRSGRRNRSLPSPRISAQRILELLGANLAAQSRPEAT